MINFVLFMSALSTSVHLASFLFVVFLCVRFVKDVWKYWTEPLNE